MTGMLATSTIPLSFAYSTGTGGRVSLPVSPSEILYANFQHVSGVAASPGQPVASIDRLKILDTLIDRLSSMKLQSPAESEKPIRPSPGRFTSDNLSSDKLSSDKLDALIQDYGSELRNRAMAPVTPYSYQAPVESGMLFSLAA